MSDYEYFSNPALNQSSFKKFMECPSIYKHELTHKPPPTQPMIFGSLVHCLILEPEEFDDRYAVFKEGKTLSSVKGEKFIKENKDKIVISETDHKHGSDMAEAVRVSKILDGIKSEYKELAGFRDVSQIPCKAKLDWFDGRWIWDYKTTASLDKFDSSFFDYGYDIQSMWYIHVFGDLPLVDGVKFLVQEKKAPYRFEIITPTFPILQDANKIIINGLKKFMLCHHNDSWLPHEKIIDRRPAYLKRPYDLFL